MNWLEYNPENEEIRESNGIADIVVGYAKTAKEAEEFAQEKDMRIAIPDWAYKQPINS